MKQKLSILQIVSIGALICFFIMIIFFNKYATVGQDFTYSLYLLPLGFIISGFAIDFVLKIFIKKTRLLFVVESIIIVLFLSWFYYTYFYW